MACARGDDPGALALYARAAELEPADATPLLRVGDHRLARDAPELAARAYDRALASAGGPRWEALLGRGLARAHRFLLEDARTDLCHAARTAAEAPLAVGEPPRERARGRVRCLVALAEVQRALGDLGGAKSSLADAVAAGPDAPAPLVALGRLELETAPQDPVAATRHLEAARALGPTDGPAAADVLEALARARLVMKDLRGAGELADLSLAALGTRGHARARRTATLVRLAQSSESARPVADAAWADAFACGSETIDGRAVPDLATALLRQGAAEGALAASLSVGPVSSLTELTGRAEAELEAVVRLDPLRAPALLVLAELRFARGRLDLAREAAERCLEVDPFRPRAHELVVLSILGTLAASDDTALERTALLRAAEDHASSALSLGETTARLVLRARARLAAGDRRGARADLDTAASATPGDLDLEALLARVKKESGEPVVVEASSVPRVRAEERSALLAQARRAREAGEAGKARALATRASAIGSPADADVRAALVLLADLADRDLPARLALLAAALGAPDAATLTAADRVLATGWGEARLDISQRSDLVERARSGDAAAGVSLALVLMEDTLLAQADPADRRSLPELADLARRAAPTSLVPWLARSLVRARADDPLSAARDLAVVREIAPGAPLVSFVAAEVAASAGNLDDARLRLSEAGKGELFQLDRRRSSSPALSRVR